MDNWILRNGQVLRDGALAVGELAIDAGRIADQADHAREIDATGLLVLPGIVDIHGDAFERQMQPRPHVEFNPVFALAETERQLLACGITTAYHGVTLSWEPGLRSVDAWRGMLAAMAARDWVCDMRIHLRWEAFNLDALDQAVADIMAGRVHMLAFNDHTASIVRKLAKPAEGAKYADRAGMKLEAFTALAHRVAARADEVPAGLGRIAMAARAMQLPMASHDDDSIDKRQHFHALGADICEFPITEAVGQYAADEGQFVVMGSPNVVRGGSHLGWASAADLAERGICRVLSSDYFYPCLLEAPFVIADRGKMDFAAAWALVSANPARAAMLQDRGELAEGRRADVILVDPTTRNAVATFAGGRLAHLSAEGARRLG
ncbi:MAG: alpha-D-ribose 1-methylphosphonate 5-triphosphate diphosphatase [Acetobacteraceae bacterium]|nr:alpha-D-ribose 1-methylphosphonate 5-triphosphate diphosphatase [Acetobacteraceae bacterium]